MTNSNNEIITNTRGYLRLLREFSTFLKVACNYYKEFASFRDVQREKCYFPPNVDYFTNSCIVLVED